MPSEARHQRGGAEQGPRSTGPRPVHAWNALDRDQRLAAVAAVLLFATMLLPWYQQNAVVSAAKSQPLVSRNLNAFAVFSFVEAAVLLVALAVLTLLYARADGRDFQLPGGDGAVVFAAGIWTALLLVLRLFDKPGIAHNGVAANVGVQWGIFFALAAAGVLAYAGSRMRAARRPEPPLLRDERRARRARRPASDDAATFGTSTAFNPSDEAAFGEPPAFDPTEDATVLAARPRASTAAPAPADRPPAAGLREQAETGPRELTEEPTTHLAEDLDAGAASKRPPYPPAPATRPRPRASTSSNGEQLSFEDPPTAGE